MRTPCKHTSGKTRMADISRLTGGPPDLRETEDWRDWAVERTCQDWIPYRDMRAKPKVAVEPSLRTTGVRRRMSRKVK